MTNEQLGDIVANMVAAQIDLAAEVAVLRDMIAEGGAAANPGVTKEMILQAMDARKRYLTGETLRHTADDSPAWASALKTQLAKLQKSLPTNPEATGPSSEKPAP